MPRTRPSTLSRARWLPAVLALATGIGIALPASAADAPNWTHRTTIFVSPDGRDHASGRSPGDPVRTLDRAQALVRQLDQHLTGDLVVSLASGTYRLASPLNLTSADSGSNGHRVLWTAAPGARPVISGGSRITGWQLTDRGHDIWSAPAPAGLTTRQLYVNGVRAQVASGPLPVTLTATATGYTASSDTLAHWRNPAGIEFVYTGGDGYWGLRTGGSGAWTEPRCRVASASGTTVTMTQPCWINSNQRVMRTDGSGRTVNLVGPQSLGNNEVPSSVENAYELLTQPGQWYLDSTANRIYYIPRAGEDPRHADVEAARLQTLVSGIGTAANPVHDIAFNGIQFSYGTWLQPSSPDGFSEIQATYTITGPTGYATQGLCQFIAGGTCPYGDWTRTPGNVSFAHDQHIAFTNDRFTHLGAGGLDLGDGSQYDTVSGSVFTDISGNGIELGGVDNPLPTTAADHTVGNTIQDNHLYGLPVEFHGGVGIDVGYAENTLITHNQVDHTAYTAISLGWGGWPDKIKQPATPNASHGNMISDNLIFDNMQLLADGGAIYTQGITGSSLADGEHITGNVIHDELDHGHAIYCDNGSTYLTATGNVLYNNENDWGARHADYTPPANGSTDDPLDLENNYWQTGDPDYNAKGVVVAGNHIIAGPADAPAATIAAAGLEPAYRHLLSTSEGWDGFGVPGAPAQASAFGSNGSAYVSFSPAFVSNGGQIRSYTVTASPGGAQATISAADYDRLHYVVLPGLSETTAYTFTVTARNRFGHSAPSLPTAPVTPAASTTPAAPNAPTRVTVYAGTGDVAVHWTPPAKTGDTPVLAYQISAPGVPTVTFTGHTALWANQSRDIFTVIGGLTPGQTYTFTVQAVNVDSPGAPAVSAPVTVG